MKTYKFWLVDSEENRHVVIVQADDCDVALSLAVEEVRKDYPAESNIWVQCDAWGWASDPAKITDLIKPLTREFT